MIRLIMVLSLLGLAHVAYSAEPDIAAKVKASAEFSNMRQPAPNVFSGGQPTKAELKQLADAGIKHIINLRSLAEQGWDEAAYVTSLGMQYHAIPVAGAADINTTKAKQLMDTLQALDGEGVVVHCASGNRIGALVAMHAGVESKDINMAITKGRKWGLTRLEPLVREKLNAGTP